MKTYKLTSPYMRGDDVLAVQKKLNLRTDAIYGPVTAGAVKAWKYRFGYPEKHINLNYTRSDRAYLFGTKEKTVPMKYRAKSRAKKAPAAGVAVMRQKSLHHMRSWAGQGLVEKPAHSNKVPTLQRIGSELNVGWEANMGWPWCAYAVMLAALKAGSSTARQGLVENKFNALYVPEIESHARAGRYGMRVVGWGEAKPGDFVTFNWDGGVPDHIGMLVQTEVGFAVCVEGNTSPSTAGSQSDGGGVYVRNRDRSQIQAIIRYS
jgi:hypothetical protein